MVSVLLHNGADPQLRDEQGFTPLGRLISVAAAPRSSYCRPDLLPVVATLLVAGASLADAYPPEYRDAYDARLGLQGIVKELGRRQRTPLPNGKQMLAVLQQKYARRAPMQKL